MAPVLQELVDAIRALFRSVRLLGYSSVRSLHEALKTRLVESPHIASYIHELEIYVLPSDASKYAVAVILSSLPNLRSLVIDGSSLIWGDRTHGIVDALEKLISQKSLQCLTISGIRNISASFVLRAASSVSVFSIRRCNTNAGDPVPELPVYFDASLTYLIVRDELLGGPDIADLEAPACVADVLLEAPACLARLERLHVQVKSAKRLLLAAPPLLRYLRIEEVLLFTDAPRMLSPFLPMLRTLEVNAVIPNGCYRVPDHFPSVFAKIAENLPSVEVIVLHCWGSPIFSSAAPLPTHPTFPMPRILHFPSCGKFDAC
ncbi:hypothetical protein C8J57DRAFT_1619970 [Mycena rebaudengoi]|nr:hypothetical protein C8J57DRAFT_1619970 [Mycena rebaudengoi]